MEVMHSSQQDMDLIDILWKQDIDLGARREVFDYNHRQKEYELQRQRELEEEKKLHLLREQEKALLAQLQLDEETGEYIPCPPPCAPLQSAGTAVEVTQNVGFAEETGDDMSFDECLQLLAETFPVVGTKNASVCMDTPAVSMPANSNIMMSPEQAALSPATLLSGQLAPPQRMTPDLEQAWMELLSLPELQQCLDLPMKDSTEIATYPLPNNPEVQNPSYSNYLQMQTPIFNLMTNVSDVKTNDPAQFMNTFDGSVPSMSPCVNFSEVNPEAQLSSSFGTDVFYLNTKLEEHSSQHGPDVTECMSDVSNKPSYTTMDLYSLSPGDPFDRSKQNLTEHPDTDSGISTHGSPNSSSPSKSAYGGESAGYNDSEMEDMDSPGSVESDYSEIFPLNYQLDNLEAPVSSPAGEPREEKKPRQRKVEPAEKSGHSSAPFTKDKPKKRSDVRLSRDEQRAKSLKIPFTVNTITNLPVDDFNELMSKHQLNEAQLALLRDIRRRGKNKVAAQNCRKRKMENIVGLEDELDSLKEEKERLLSEKNKKMTDLKEMKQQLHGLYQEVFSLLRDEKGNSYSPLDYSLQQSTDGSVFLVPRVKKTFRSEANH